MLLTSATKWGFVSSCSCISCENCSSSRPSASSSETKASS